MIWRQSKPESTGSVYVLPELISGPVTEPSGSSKPAPSRWCTSSSSSSIDPPPSQAQESFSDYGAASGPDGASTGLPHRLASAGSAPLPGRRRDRGSDLSPTPPAGRAACSNLQQSGKPKLDSASRGQSRRQRDQTGTLTSLHRPLIPMVTYDRSRCNPRPLQLKRIKGLLSIFPIIDLFVLVSS